MHILEVHLHFPILSQDPRPKTQDQTHEMHV